MIKRVRILLGISLLLNIVLFVSRSGLAADNKKFRQAEKYWESVAPYKVEGDNRQDMGKSLLV